MTTKVVDTPVNQLEIWEGTEEQIRAKIDSGEITDESLAIATDVSFVKSNEVGSGVLTIQKNGETIATFNANSSEDVVAGFSVTEPVQPNWNQKNSDSLDYIRNKPTITTITVKRFA